MIDDHPRENADRENFFSKLKKKLTGSDKRTDDITRQQIKDIAEEGHEDGILPQNERDILINIVEFSKKEAHDVMVHRKGISAIDASSTVEEAIHRTMQDGFSRYPVYVDDLDQIIGIFHIRDLVKAYINEDYRQKKLTEIRSDILIDAYNIPETQNISRLFRDMQKEKIHMAIVFDEHGQTAGLVTMEDILEEIFGNIWDEHDEPDSDITKNADGSYIISGITSLEEVGKTLGIEFDMPEIYTLNGFLTNKLGRIPEENEVFETVYSGYRFKVVKVENKVITKIRALKIEEKNNE